MATLPTITASKTNWFSYVRNVNLFKANKAAQIWLNSSSSSRQGQHEASRNAAQFFWPITI